MLLARWQPHVHAGGAEDPLAVYPLPTAGGDLVGVPKVVTAAEEDTLVRIARRYRTGYGAIREANPAVDSWLPGEGTRVVLPTWHVLPDAVREGIVINTAEMRLYHFQAAGEDGTASVGVYAISIGRDGRETPLASARVTRKAKHPSWYPPDSIRREREQNGQVLPPVVPPGPDNPLGTRAIYLDLPSYLIHGTNRPLGIGMQVTAGCVRMYPEDIEYLFAQVAIGSKVQIVHQPVKAGLSGDVLYVEVHDSLEGVPEAAGERMQMMREAIARAVGSRSGFRVNWDLVELAVIESSGIPVPVGAGEEALEMPMIIGAIGSLS
ncbi:MAG TPA: L,D-transpeptidase family protein [Kineobactrum sp.]